MLMLHSATSLYSFIKLAVNWDKQLWVTWANSFTRALSSSFLQIEEGPPCLLRCWPAFSDSLLSLLRVCVDVGELTLLTSSQKKAWPPQSPLAHVIPIYNYQPRRNTYPSSNLWNSENSYLVRKKMLHTDQSILWKNPVWVNSRRV